MDCSGNMGRVGKNSWDYCGDVMTDLWGQSAGKHMKIYLPTITFQNLKISDRTDICGNSKYISN